MTCWPGLRMVQAFGIFVKQKGFTIAKLLADRQALQKLLLNHVVSGALEDAIWAPVNPPV